MAGFIKEFWGLAFPYIKERVIKPIITKEGLRSFLRRAITFNNVFCMIVLLILVHQCGTHEDIDSFFSFFHSVYNVSISPLFKDILTVLGTVWLIWYACSIRYTRVRVVTRQIMVLLTIWFTEVHTGIWVFFSLEDEEHEGRNTRDKISDKPKRRFGIPRAFRLPFQNRGPSFPRPPSPPPGTELHNRVSSDGSGTGKRNGSAQSEDSGLRSPSGNCGVGPSTGSGQQQNGGTSGSKRGKKKKRR